MLIADTQIMLNFVSGDILRTGSPALPDPICLSVVTYMDVFREVKKKGGSCHIIKDPPFRVLHIRDEISFRAICLYTQYAEKRKLSMRQAFIAATAMFYNLPILTETPMVYSDIPGVNLLSCKSNYFTSSKSIKSA